MGIFANSQQVASQQQSASLLGSPAPGPALFRAKQPSILSATPAAIPMPPTDPRAAGPLQQPVDIPAQYPLFSKTQVTENVPGMVSPGNIDLTKRPVVRNHDGTISTVYTTSYSPEKGPNAGKEVLIPRVSNEGTIMTEHDAVKYWGEKGQNFGAFDSVEAADAYAKILHEQLYDPSRKPIGGNLKKPYAPARTIRSWDELYGGAR
jgi:hypothetical protein